ncbi:MAG: 4Fe-4S dicluster domain-containing protein [Candidatus Eremiobacteraeota bacterium]|nr:4Fe-4S dicluster domain-containing protein [Candidatus Eremiobacteraeota bacterium]
MIETSETQGYAGPDRPADDDLSRCTRCGLCEQACPTYRELRVEPDSPRGRVFLMKQVADGAAGIDAHLAEHLYLCLGCRACETACPSGVPYGRLLELARYQIEERGEIAPERRGWRRFRHFAFEQLLPNERLFKLAMAPAQALQRVPWLASLAAAIAPGRLRRLLDMIPRNGATHGALPFEIPAEGERRARAGLFTGCVMGSLFAHVHESLARVLRHNGCDVIVARAQWCCGALNLHAGERTHARAMAKRNIDAFERAGVDFIVLDSAGCGAAMKEYGELLRDDPQYAQRAHDFGAKVKDVSELLHDLGIRTDFGTLKRRVTYQDACHLAHAQRVRMQPRALLAQIPGLDYIELQYADRCCGAAGVYNLTQPELSAKILEEKLDAIEETNADYLVTGNPGCHMQIQAGLKRRGLRTKVKHLVEVLDEAYSQPKDM